VPAKAHYYGLVWRQAKMRFAHLWSYYLSFYFISYWFYLLSAC